MLFFRDTDYRIPTWWEFPLPPAFPGPRPEAPDLPEPEGSPPPDPAPSPPLRPAPAPSPSPPTQSPPARDEPYRGRPTQQRREGDARVLTNPQGAWDEKTKAPRRSTTRDTGTWTTGRAGRVISGSVIAGAGNELVSIYADLWYRQQRLIAQRRRILAVGRRGAAATRPVVADAIGRTNRTGARSTPVVPQTRPATQPAVEPKPKPQPQPQPQPARTVPTRIPGTRPVIGDPWAFPRPASWPRPQPQVQPQRILPRVLPQVQPRVSPRAVPRTPVAPRAVPRSPVAPRAVPRAPLATPGVAPGQPLISPMIPDLTPFASPGVGYSLQPRPQTKQDKCDCTKEDEKKKSREPQCRNPVVSRRVRNGYIYIKRKLQCLPFKLK